MICISTTSIKYKTVVYARGRNMVVANDQHVKKYLPTYRCVYYYWALHVRTYHETYAQYDFCNGCVKYTHIMFSVC